MLQRLQVLYENLRAPEVFLTDGASRDDSSTGKLRRRKHQKICLKSLLWCILLPTVGYFVLFCAPVVCDAAGEVGLTGGTPVLMLFSFLSGIKTNNHQQILFNVAVFAFYPYKWRFPLTLLRHHNMISTLTDPSLLVPCRDSCTLGRRVTRHALLMCWISIILCWWETLFMWLRKFCKKTNKSKEMNTSSCMCL